MVGRSQTYPCCAGAGPAAEAHIRWAAKVTIEQFSSIGEVIGALATVATLAYLAVQIRANTRMMRTQASHASQALTSPVAMGLAHDQRLAGIFRRGIASFDSLGPDEQIQFTFLMAQFLSIVEQIFNDVGSGVSDPAALERAWASTRHLVRSPGGRAFWERQGRISFPPAFRSFVESDLSSREELDPQTPAHAAQQSAAAVSA